jgi:hypothetical protein
MVTALTKREIKQKKATTTPQALLTTLTHSVCLSVYIRRLWGWREKQELVPVLITETGEEILRSARRQPHSRPSHSLQLGHGQSTCSSLSLAVAESSGVMKARALAKTGVAASSRGSMIASAAQLEQPTPTGAF